MEFRPSRFEILPPAIKNLLIINVLCFLAQNTLGKAGGFPIDDMFALHAWQSPLFRPWQLVTHLFMHGGFSHIFFNMLALWMFGAVLENVWGTKRFIIFYLISGLGAAFIHLLALSYELVPFMNDYSAVMREQVAGGGGNALLIDFIMKYDGIGFISPNELVNGLRHMPAGSTLSHRAMEAVSTYYDARINSATLGASGAVFGILAAFGYLFPNTYLYIYFLFPIKAKYFVILYGAFELYEGIRNSAGDNVAHWAHLGGALVGLIIVITWNKNNRRTHY